MSKAKVTDLNEIAKLKIELAKTATKCKCEGCDKHIVGLGFCQKHYKMFKKHGDPIFKRKVCICRVENCKEKVHSNNFCTMHYSRFKTHGDPNHITKIMKGQSKHKNYNAWRTMKDRILNPNNQKYSNYGGRGLSIQESWVDPIYGFFNFLKDMRDSPDSCTLDRINNDKGYYKENCRWATIHLQNSNRRDNNEIVGIFKQCNKWNARMTFKGKKLNKSFKTKQAAILQRKFWELKYNIYKN